VRRPIQSVATIARRVCAQSASIPRPLDLREREGPPRCERLSQSAPRAAERAHAERAVAWAGLSRPRSRSPRSGCRSLRVASRPPRHATPGQGSARRSTGHDFAVRNGGREGARVRVATALRAAPKLHLSDLETCALLWPRCRSCCTASRGGRPLVEQGRRPSRTPCRRAFARPSRVFSRMSAKLELRDRGEHPEHEPAHGVAPGPHVEAWLTEPDPADSSSRMFPSTSPTRTTAAHGRAAEQPPKAA